MGDMHTKSSETEILSELFSFPSEAHPPKQFHESFLRDSLGKIPPLQVGTAKIGKRATHLLGFNTLGHNAQENGY